MDTDRIEWRSVRTNGESQIGSGGDLVTDRDRDQIRVISRPGD